MKKQAILTPVLALIGLSTAFLPQSAKGQFSAGLNISGNIPLRSTSDSVPGIRSGASFALKLNYNFTSRISMNVTTSRRMINTSGGFEALAHQYGYTQQKGFMIHSRSAGLTVLAVGVGANLLSIGTTSCGANKPSLILGARGGVLLSDSKIDNRAMTEDGTTVLALQQTGKTSSPYYEVSLDLIYPVSNSLSLVTGAAWSRAASKMDLQRTSNGSSTISHFTYSDLQFSVGVQIGFGSGHHGQSQPQARTEGQPIGGIVVKGGQNPGAGTRPKGNAMVAGSPIGGIVVKGGKNPGGGDTTKASIVYNEPHAIDNPALLAYLGTDELVIEKGEYPMEYSDAESKALLHLHSNGIIHRDLAARSITFEGTNPDGHPITYTIEPQYVNGVAKDILVTYKGITEKGIK